MGLTPLWRYGMNVSSRRPRRLAFLVLATAAAATLLAACGGSSKSSSGNTPSTGTTTPPASTPSSASRGGIYRVGWEGAFNFTDGLDPTGEYLGDAFSI